MFPAQRTAQLSNAIRRRQSIASYSDKRRALAQLVSDCSDLHVSLRDRVRVVADELMINALYHAPPSPKAGSGASLPAISLRYRLSEQGCLVWVRDEFGSLKAEDLLRHLRTRPLPCRVKAESGGSLGLGMSMVLRACSELRFHLSIGRFTEVLARVKGPRSSAEFTHTLIAKADGAIVNVVRRNPAPCRARAEKAVPRYAP